jgi:NAD(P)-dependent dehydrogenase (short-subunit alcohol dehydrogenase family)
MLKNKLSVITGFNRGIRKAIVEKFAENGSDIL